MAWQNLAAIQLNQTGGYAPLPMGEAGGEINIRIPAFSAGEAGAYLVGIYSGSAENPSLISQQQVSITPYARHFLFTIPANVSGLVVGLQLVSSDNLETASYSVVVQWQLVNPINQFPGNFSLPLALTLEQVTGIIGANLGANYPSYADLSALELGLEQFLQSLPQIAPVYSGQSPPENPNEGDLWWELDDNGARVRPWPWQRFGIYWASSVAQYVSSIIRLVDSTRNVNLEAFAAWAGEEVRVITSVSWSFLRAFSNANDSDWDIKLSVRRTWNSLNTVSEVSLSSIDLSPQTPLILKDSSPFAMLGQNRQALVQITKVSGAGEIDIEMSAEVRAMRV